MVGDEVVQVGGDGEALLAAGLVDGDGTAVRR